MIHSLKIKNFLSFKDEVTFSFEATKDSHLEKSHVVEVAKGVRLSRLAVVYGANASGKSNLIKAFNFLSFFWNSIPSCKEEETGIVPFMLSKETPLKPSFFKLIFFINSKKYIYTLEALETHVVLESVDYYHSKQPKTLFTRVQAGNKSSIIFHKSLKVSQTAKEEIEIKCLPNMSVFAAFSQVNISITEIDQIIIWQKKQLLQPIFPHTALTAYAKKAISSDVSKRKYVVEFLKHADFNITDIDVETTKESLDIDFIEKLKSDDTIPLKLQKKIIQEKGISITKAYFSHSITNSRNKLEEFRLPEELQSLGTLRTMGLSCVFNIAIERNAFAAVDEIESSLHPLLVEFVLEKYLKSSDSAQLLVTTHYDGLLEEDDLLRNDNIWFTNKKKDGSTELYSLSEFNGVNRISSLRKAYRFGKFGATPNI